MGLLCLRCASLPFTAAAGLFWRLALGSLSKEVENIDLIGLSSTIIRGLALLILATPLSPSLDQNLESLKLALCCSPMTGSLALSILAIQLSSNLNQSLDDLNLALRCSPMEWGISVFVLLVDIFLLALGKLINHLANEQCRSPTHQRQCAKTCCYGVKAKQGKTRSLAKGSQSGCGADGRQAGDSGGIQCCCGNSNSRPDLSSFLEQPFEAWSPAHQSCRLLIIS